MNDQQVVLSALQAWGIEPGTVRTELDIAGSPERSEFRAVVESRDARLYLLENISERSCQRKEQIAAVLDLLAGRGLGEAVPYLKNSRGEHVVRCGQKWWQLQPFVEGVALDRPGYAFEGWRGEAAARVLTDIHRCARRSPALGEGPVFSMPSYVRGIIGDMREHDPGHLFRVEAGYRFLNGDFFGNYQRLPAEFCHGDYHPLNIIWSDAGIRAVIDWEFCGPKPELYDAANMVGCLGMENPRSLDGECVLRFLGYLREHGSYQRLRWQYFLEWIVANRFGWMAEWLRKKDWEMVEMEGDYWEILLERRGHFREVWGLTAEHPDREI